MPIANFFCVSTDTLFGLNDLFGLDDKAYFKEKKFQKTNV